MYILENNNQATVPYSLRKGYSVGLDSFPWKMSMYTMSIHIRGDYSLIVCCIHVHPES
jgi:hypothetical protein